MYEVYTNTTIGSRHIDKGIVCQDFSGSFRDGSTIIAAVSDGHGSPQYFRSDRGSRFAVEAAIQCLSEFAGFFSEETQGERKIPLSVLLNEDNRDEIMTQLYKSILSRWCGRVDKDYAEDPFTEQDFEGLREKYVLKYQSGQYLPAYGATLIAVLMTGKYWLAIHIGDGKLVCIGDNGECSQPVPWDDDCVGAVTTSICQDDALSKFRYYLSTELPTAICFGSDGIDDTYGDGEILHTFYKQLVLEFTDSGYETTAKEIEELLPEITRNGSHDDVTVALLFDPGKVRNCRELMSLQITLSKNADELERLDYKLKRAERRAENLRKKIEELEAEKNTDAASKEVGENLAEATDCDAILDEILKHIKGDVSDNAEATAEARAADSQPPEELTRAEQPDGEDDEITQKIKSAEADYEAAMQAVEALQAEIKLLKKESAEAQLKIADINGE